MKRKVDDEEPKPEAAEEMATNGEASLDKEFAELEKSSVDDDLASLKAQMSGSDTTTEAKAETETKTDSDLENLKKEMGQ